MYQGAGVPDVPFTVDDPDLCKMINQKSYQVSTVGLSVSLTFEQIKLTTDEPKSTYYLLQRISILLQRSNAASIIESLGPKTDLKEVFEL